MNDEPIISWKVAGIALGLLLTLATFLVSPLGVSTQFVVTDAIVLHEITSRCCRIEHLFITVRREI